MPLPPFQPLLQPRQLEHAYCWEGIPVLTLRLSLPQAQGQGKGVRRLNRYYQHLETCLLAWAETCHRKTALLAQSACRACRPLPEFAIRVGYQVTDQSETHLSLLWTLEQPGCRDVFADLWRWPQATPISRRELLSPALRRKIGAAPLIFTPDGLCILRDGQPIPLPSPGR